jgi:hypothetical protein
MYIRSDVLATATYQWKHRFDDADLREAYRATHGINVLLHEWAHAAAQISNEALAQCWAGQWLDDFEQQRSFSSSIIEVDGTAFWDNYNARIDAGDGYGDRACAEPSWDAPNLFSAQSVVRPARPVGPPPPPPPTEDPAFAVASQWMSWSPSGPAVSSYPYGTTEVFLNLRFRGAVSQPHVIDYFFTRPNGQTFYRFTQTVQVGWTSAWASTHRLDHGPLDSGTWLVRFAFDGHPTGSQTFLVG